MDYKKLSKFTLLFGFLILPAIVSAIRISPIPSIVLGFILFIVINKMRKHLLELDAKRKKNLRDLKKACMDGIYYLEMLLDKLPYLTETDKRVMTHDLYTEIKFCNSIEDYMSLFLKTKIKIRNAEERIKEYKAEQRSRTYRYNQRNIQHDEANITINDCLSIMGLSSDINDFNIIKKQYRTLMLKYHPDRNRCVDAEEKAKEINLAYDKLKRVFA